jgi:hypothetical protein
MGSIFINYPAKQRIAVGDLSQQINQWNGASSFLYNFSKKEDVVIAELTNTMRCSPEIAKAAEIFCKNNLNKDFTYLGLNKNKPTYNSFLYLTRTNAELVKALSVVQASEIKSFGLTRKIDDIFKLFLLIRFKLKDEHLHRTLNENKSSEKWNKEDEQYYKIYNNYTVERWLILELLNKKTTIDKLRHSLKELNSTTIYHFDETKDELVNTIASFSVWLTRQNTLIFEHEDMIRAATIDLSLNKQGVDTYDVYKFAKNNVDTREPALLLSTANSAKGLTADCTYMSKGLSIALEKEWEENIELTKLDKSLLLCDPDDDDNELENEMANLYYVAFTRSRYCTIGAKLIGYKWHNPSNIKEHVEYEGCKKDELDFIRMIKESEEENALL